MSAPEVTILRALLAANGGWVSGSKLAAQLGVSRVAVWHHLEKLRTEGFAFEGKPAQGYRLSARPAGLSGPLIDAQLQIRPKDFSLVVLDEIDSTNDEAARQLAAGRPAPFVVLARRQTRGRGRFGRAWHSAANGNLYASFAFRPRVPPDRMQTFTLWMGVNVCELIVNFTGLNPGLKWPNDLVFADRKAGGMLTEARVDADHIRDLVFGLGLNINSGPGERGGGNARHVPEGWPGELSHRAISLSEVAGGPLDFNRLTAALIGRVLLAYDAFSGGEHRRTFADLWNRFDLLKGRTVVVVEGERRHAGTVTGVDDEGGLVLRDEWGRSQRFRAGEVTLEK
jgi:BirA family biotin operon repressor/biotin-[acetyl-CoA-carboxylase] ligase